MEPPQSTIEAPYQGWDLVKETTLSLPQLRSMFVPLALHLDVAVGCLDLPNRSLYVEDDFFSFWIERWASFGVDKIPYAS